MNRQGDSMFVRGDQDAGISMFDVNDSATEKLPGSFAVPNANAVSKFGDFVEIFSCFFGHAELAFAKASFHVFGRVARERDLKIMDKRRAVHGDAGNQASFHQIDQNGTEADLNDVATDAPENGFALFARAVDCGEEIAKIFGSKNVRE